MHNNINDIDTMPAMPDPSSVKRAASTTKDSEEARATARRQKKNIERNLIQQMYTQTIHLLYVCLDIFHI